uniref:Cystathionine gamma-synthase, chloroplastic n=1 Tax=Tanacetum cinerariifolium TaxID=118510 RepID=A0A6L2J0R0_TANCI|nr:cystathionine gamma-synthase, chloroplastic [Tanacetum cinerariifolium]
MSKAVNQENESQKEENFEIDQMAPPSQQRTPLERNNGNIGFPNHKAQEISKNVKDKEDEKISTSGKDDTIILAEEQKSEAPGIALETVESLKKAMDEERKIKLRIDLEKPNKDSAVTSKFNRYYRIKSYKICARSRRLARVVALVNDKVTLIYAHLHIYISEKIFRAIMATDHFNLLSNDTRWSFNKQWVSHSLLKTPCRPDSISSELHSAVSTNSVKRGPRGNGDSDTTTTKFIDSLKISYIASSFGDVESIVDEPTIVSYWICFFRYVRQSEKAKYEITNNLVCFSFGVEDFEDLKAHVPTGFGGDIAIVHCRVHTNPNLIHPKRFFSHTSVDERRPDVNLENFIFAGR